MRFLVVDSVYDEFLGWLYRTRPQLATASFEEQRRAYVDTLFAASDFYSHALSEIGHPAEDIVLNNAHAQLAWWQERQTASAAAGAVDQQGAPAEAPGAPSWIVRRREQLDRMRLMLGGTPLRHLKPLARSFLRKLDDARGSMFTMLEAQVAAAGPDVLYVHTIYSFSDEQLARLKRHVRHLIGQHAATELPRHIDYRLYDLIVSSFPPTIDDLRGRGARAELVRLAFDPRVAEAIPAVARTTEASFVGSIYGVHTTRLKLLERVAAAVPGLVVHGNVTIPLTAGSALKSRIEPALWGREMFRLLRASKITLNHHGDVLPFANNMRLYEATGLGCLLVTDDKDNLVEMFEPGREVVAYKDEEECVDKVRYYLDPRHDSEREAIAAAGRERTLREHTYRNRMREVVRLVEAL